MPLILLENDITRMQVDAIVNAANPSLLGGGGVDGAIHRAAGPELLRECRALGGCETGEAKLTRGYNLPCRYVIHTVGPIWQGGWRGEKRLLASCYRSSLALAKAHGCETVAFPLISSGAYGYPPEQALRVAVDVITDFLRENDMTVTLVTYDKGAFRADRRLLERVTRYLERNAGPLGGEPCMAEKQEDDILWDACPAPPPLDGDRAFPRELPSEAWVSAADEALPKAPGAPKAARPTAVYAVAPAQSRADMGALTAMLDHLDEGFAQALFRKIDERGMTDVDCYKRANIDRKLFSKIKGNPDYRPSKQTAVAFVIALRLPKREAVELLQKAGYALSRSSRFDCIVEYCIDHGVWNIHEVNEVLFAFDQSLLGAG